MRLTLKMKKLLLITYLIPLFFSTSVASQEEGEKLNEILKNLQGGPAGISGSTALQPEDLGYKSFVQNELKNIFAQIDALSEQDRNDITFRELNAKRIELATSLCSRDSRACFLIEEYLYLK